MSSGISIPETPWSVEEEDWGHGTTLYRLIDATGDPVLGFTRLTEDEKPMLETICMAVNAFAVRSPPTPHVALMTAIRAALSHYQSDERLPFQYVSGLFNAYVEAGGDPDSIYPTGVALGAARGGRTP